MHASFNRRGPFTLLIDTAAGVTLLNARIVSETGGGRFKAGKRRVTSGEEPGRDIGYVTHLSELDLGPIRLKQMDVIVTDLSAMERDTNLRVDGFLGFPAIAHRCLKINFATGEIWIQAESEAICSGEGEILPFRVTSGGAPEIPVWIDGEEVWLRVDSGSAFGVVLDEEIVAGRAVTFLGESEASGNLLGEETMSVAQLNGTMRIGHEVIEQPTVHVSAKVASHIGMQVLRSYVMTFDISAGKLWFERAR